MHLLFSQVAKEKTLPFEIWQTNPETIAAMEDPTHFTTNSRRLFCC
ncbi:hypothetical protein [Acinetobacter rongchengensis]|nr:hypothetical protein [Acinetobacter rongchengensis]